MGDLLDKIKDWWQGSDRSQKIMTIGGCSFLLILLVGTFYFASKPKMALLFGGLTPAQQGSVVTELEKLGISADFNERGDVLVPSNQVSNARMQLANENKLPTTVGFGDTELASLGVMETPTVEKERLKQILEEKLENAIDSISGIESSNVQIALGDNSPFVRDTQAATASVTITERGNTSVSKEEGRNIAILVSNSVPGLQMAHVAVLDSQMNLLYDGKKNDSVEGKVADKLTTQQNEENRRARTLQSMLDQVYGPNSTIVNVALSLDFDNKKYTEQKNTPSDKLETGNIQETMQGGGPISGGVAGATSNINNQAGAPASITGGKGEKYKMIQKQTEYMKDTMDMSVDQAAGSLKSMTVDVIANSSKVKNPSELQSIVDGYLGSHLTQPGFADKVTLVKFDTTAQKAAQAATRSANSQQRIQQVIAILPILALVVIGFIVMKQITKFTSQGSQLALAGGKGSLPMGSRDYDLQAMESGSGMRTPEELESAVRVATANTDDRPSLVDVGNIETKINVPLEQIRKMSEKRPEAVAMLLKGWVMEERN